MDQAIEECTGGDHHGAGKDGAAIAQAQTTQGAGASILLLIDDQVDNLGLLYVQVACASKTCRILTR